ncbi:hypothetical protein [Hoeflea sp.]
MENDPFFPRLDAARPIPAAVILILGTLLTGIALALFSILFL